MTNSTIVQRIDELRAILREEKMDAFIFPSTDPHHGEYVPDHWKGREYVSGFNGSAGTVVVTLDEAALWTDSRYFLAAEEQLQGTGIVLMKERMQGTPSITGWLGQKLCEVKGAVVGVDGMVNSAGTVKEWAEALKREGGITLRTNFDPLQRLWKNRPPLPSGSIVVHPLAYAGESCAEKLARVRQWMKEHTVCGIFVSALDDIAWLTNLRGTDVHCTPVFVAYMLVMPEKAVLFADKEQMTEDALLQMRQSGVEVAPYSGVGDALKQYGEYNILMDEGETSYTLYNKVRCMEKRNGASPVPMMKAVKNDAEIAGFRRAMVRDGVAMVRFLRWLKPAVQAGGQTEMSIDRQLTLFRAEQEQFRDISFDTIAGYQEHGAIVHYEATPETDALLKAEGFLLLDSGAQYADGTTDITRTIVLGPLTPEQRHVYTLVLKGHIRLAMAKFPEGATGTQIDMMARSAMWREGMNYMHGTGHGVGSYLSVHEGPHQIRMEWRGAPLLPGMTVTNEPGLYLDHRFGVRIENTMLVTPYMQTEFGKFLQLEPLTLCPIDMEPVNAEELEPEETLWLNGYHRHVFETLSPWLQDEEREWLRQATRPIICQRK